MEQLELNNGVSLPALGLGVFQTPADETRDAVATALQAGYRHVDTAAAYGNERGVGDAVRDSGLARDEVFLETKVWISDYGYDETFHAFDKSAGKLQVDQIDLLIPAPGAALGLRQDPRCLPGAGDAAGRRQGPRDRGQQLHGRAPHRAARQSAGRAGGQPNRGAPLLPTAGSAGIRRPARHSHPGVVPDRWDHPLPRRQAHQHSGRPVIGEIAQAHDKSPAQVMLRWHLQQGRSVIPKSIKAHRIVENFDVFDFELSDADLSAIDDLNTDRRGGPEPTDITLESSGRAIPEA